MCSGPLQLVEDHCPDFSSLIDRQCLWNEQMQIELLLSDAPLICGQIKEEVLIGLRISLSPDLPETASLHVGVKPFYLPSAPPRPMHPTIVPVFITSCLKDCDLFSLCVSCSRILFTEAWNKDQKLNSPYRPHLSINNMTLFKSTYKCKCSRLQFYMLTPLGIIYYTNLNYLATFLCIMLFCYEPYGYY